MKKTVVVTLTFERTSPPAADVGANADPDGLDACDTVVGDVLDGGAFQDALNEYAETLGYPIRVESVLNRTFVVESWSGGHVLTEDQTVALHAWADENRDGGTTAWGPAFNAAMKVAMNLKEERERVTDSLVPPVRFISGTDLRNARLVAGWSLRELARCMGIDMVLLGQIERGVTSLDPNVLSKFQKVMSSAIRPASFELVAEPFEARLLEVLTEPQKNLLEQIAARPHAKAEGRGGPAWRRVANSLIKFGLAKSEVNSSTGTFWLSITEEGRKVFAASRPGAGVFEASKSVVAGFERKVASMLIDPEMDRYGGNLDRLEDLDAELTRGEIERSVDALHKALRAALSPIESTFRAAMMKPTVTTRLPYTGPLPTCDAEIYPRVYPGGQDVGIVIRMHKHEWLDPRSMNLVRAWLTKAINGHRAEPGTNTPEKFLPVAREIVRQNLLELCRSGHVLAGTYDAKFRFEVRSPHDQIWQDMIQFTPTDDQDKP